MSLLRPVGRSLLGRRILSTPARPTVPVPLRNNRFLFTTAPKQKRSSFKSFVTRWAVAGGLIYAYTTSNVFADEPKFVQDELKAISPEDQDRPRSLLPEKGGKLERLQGSTAGDDGRLTVGEARGGLERRATESAGPAPGPGGPEDLEAEAGQEGAFNPETGEINWDCPCLGGMAHGPCGEEFRAAFSCFVFSKEDPKGVDCIEKFRDMQACFHKHPELYGIEDEDEEEELAEGQSEKKPLEVLDSKNPEATPSPATSSEAPSSTRVEPEAVLDPKNPEETPSPATSSEAPSSTRVDPETAKSDAEPVEARSQEDTVADTKEGASNEN